MRITTLIFLLLLSTAAGAQHNPFSKLKYDKVIMYDFEGGKGSDLYIVNDKSQLAGSIRKQVQLSQNEAGRLSAYLGRSQSYGGATASCFDPHLGFVYYLQGRIVAHVTVCLDCNRLRSSIDIPAQKQGRVGARKKAYYTSEGLSVSFRKYLNGLLQDNGFSHQLKEGQ